MIVKLTQPIQAHGKEISELDFRAPNTGDFVECGFPFELSQKGSNMTMIPQTDAICALISRLGSIPISSAKQLTFNDFMTCMGTVLNFSGAPTPAPLSNGASTSRGSGNGTHESLSS